jgi:formate-nitrite transporter family protein
MRTGRNAFYVVAGGLEPWQNALVGHVVPALIGNVIGGVSLVAALNRVLVTS